MNSVGSGTIVKQERKEETKEVVVKSYQEMSKIILGNGNEAIKKAEAIHDKRPTFPKK